MTTGPLRKWLVLVIYLVFASFVFVLWLRPAIDHNHNKPLLCLHTMVTGQAPRPYVRRQLIPDNQRDQFGTARPVAAVAYPSGPGGSAAGRDIRSEPH